MSINRSDVLRDQQRQNGFTLIELVGVSAIIAVLIGLLLPVVQKAREAVNEKNASRHLRVIKEAEQHFYEEEHDGGGSALYTNDFVKLHLNSEFPCADPGCGTRQNNGYLFQISIDQSGQSFTAVATPAVLGKTGSARCVVDPTGPPVCAPIDGAEDAT